MKKKIIFTFVLGLLSIGVINIKNENIKVKADSNFTYQADFSNGLPESFQAYGKSLKNHISASKGTSSAVLTYNSSTSSNVSDSNYYGTLYNITASEYKVSDFTLEMDFKATSWLNETRWFGVLYHTDFDDNNMLSGYMMNYRVNGQTAQSTVTSTPRFNDALVKASGTYPTLAAKTVHTLKIVSSGNSISHYMDNNLIITYNTSTYANSYFGGKDQTSGGFALILSNISLEISRLSITGTTTNEKNKKIVETDDVLANVYDPEDNLSSVVTVNSRVETIQELEAIRDANGKPANTFLYVDENMDIIDESGYSIGISLLEAYKNYLTGKPYSSIPVVFIKCEEIADSFIKYYNENLNISDIAVAGLEDIVSKVRSKIKNIRGIVDYTSFNINKDSLKNIVAASNIACANTVILDSFSATNDNIFYLQARFKSVLVQINTEYEALSAIANGADGIITRDFAKGFSYLNSFSSMSKPMNGHSFNVAHRGMSYTSYENSKEGCELAMEYGATHLEIDGQITKDGKIAIIHDDTLDRTTDHTGSVSSYTSSELKNNVKILKNYAGRKMGNGVPVPMLEDIFELVKDTDVVIVLEIKSGDAKFASILKNYLDDYNMYDHVVCISFYSAQLKLMKQILPEIPTADLNSYSMSNLESALPTLYSNNMGIDDNKGYVTDEFTYQIGARGFGSWYWTYDSEEAISQAYGDGIIGITNNYPDRLFAYPTKINTLNEYGTNYVLCYSKEDFEALAIDKEELIFYVDTYGGKSSTTVTAKVLTCDVHDRYADVIYYAKYTVNKVTYTVFSKTTRIVYDDDYQTVTGMNKILAKNVKDLTRAEKVSLKKMLTSYEILLPEDQRLVNRNLILSKIDELKYYEEGNDDEEHKDSSSSSKTSDSSSSKIDQSVNSSSSTDSSIDNKKEEDVSPRSGCSGSSSSSLFIGLFGLLSIFYLYRRKTCK